VPDHVAPGWGYDRSMLKKLIIIVVLIALGAIAAKRLRTD
jgi:hypothetical protein